MIGCGKEEWKADGIGDLFQKETKYTADSIGGHSLDWKNMPSPFKNYPSPLVVIDLPEPDLTNLPSVGEVLLKRRSIRAYSGDRPMAFRLLSTLLWATQGITATSGDWSFRTAPSAGGLYPIETYVLVHSVEGLEEGIYHFRPHVFDLEFIRRGDFSRTMANAALGQAMIRAAQVTFIWTAVIERSKWKYRQRAYRYIYVDVGHICQNLYLAGTAAGLGVCAIGAFFDDDVNSIIGVDGKDETAVYCATVGLL
jgi:SagB-type dehydrogenase family enzyme